MPNNQRCIRDLIVKENKNLSIQRLFGIKVATVLVAILYLQNCTMLDKKQENY
jgi:hypothetical protein